MNTISSLQIRKNTISTAYHFMCQTDIQTGYVLHPFDVLLILYDPARQSYAMSTANCQKALLDLLFVCITRIITHIFHGFLQLLPSHTHRLSRFMNHAATPCQEIFFLPIPQNNRFTDTQTYFLQPLPVNGKRLYLLPNLSR